MSWVESILKEYPEFFPKGEESVFYGIYVQKGWKDLLIDVLDDIYYEVENHKCDDLFSPKIVFEQIKEKFGLLTIYVSYENVSDILEQKINNIIHEAERKSANICECCGEFGRIRTGGWVRVLCHRCIEEQYEN